ncbi:MAG: hypothetical protein N4A74_11285 [Carboxylicivirga sp.]|jgi:hypothetical protein|nr:hypothetical protein [Carboxylicivirga sp.]
MRIALITILSLLAYTAQSQAVYDSLTNIPPTKISCLVGQSATIVEVNELYPAKQWTNKLSDASLINKQYTIANIEADKSRPQVWITLVSNNDTIYYRLTKANMKHAPFMVNGYFEKQKQLFLDKQLKLKIDYEYTEVKSGKVLSFTTADTFNCTGLCMADSSGELVPSYILKNTEGETINVPLKGFETTATNTIDRFILLN